MTDRPTVAVLWRGDDAHRHAGFDANERLAPIARALEDAGIAARAVVHRDEIAATVRDELVGVDGVLVWVDPIGGGEDRRTIDAILRDVAQVGAWVSAHPDVVAAMGTKEVLWRTRDLGWGGDVRRWDSLEALRAGLLASLESGPRVLKPRYGNGGIGVWKVAIAGGAGSAEPTLAVQGAEVRDTTVEELRTEELLGRLRQAFDDGGCVIDQAFQPRVAEGLVRCYLVGSRVVGFARQNADPLLAEGHDASRVLGLPSAKTMAPADDPALAGLRASVQEHWVPAMRERLDLAATDLPVLWDADFLLGPPTDAGDSYVLCEINCSCVTPFPPSAPAAIAAAVHERVAR